MDAFDKLRSCLNETTARFPSEPEERLAHDHLQLVVEASPSGLLLIDCAGNVMMANSEVERVFGYPRNELLDRPLAGLITQRLRGQHVQFRIDFMAHPSIGASGTGHELFGLRKDRSEFPIEVKSNPVTVAGRAMVLAAVVDISERKRGEAALRASEERWRSVFENTAMGIAVIGEDLRHVATNSAYRVLLGHEEGELTQLTPMDISVGEERRLTQKRLMALRCGELKRLDIETQYRRKDGDLIWVHDYSSVASDEQGKVVIIKIIIDISRSNRAQSALREAQSELARASRLMGMGQLTASIAHEINQPLQAVLANGNAGLRWLRKRPPRLDQVEDTLKQIVSDADRAGRTIESVRAIFNRDDSERLPVDINQLIAEVLELLRGELEARWVSVRTELSPRLPKPTAARGQIELVILNLITNAAEAMMSAPEGGRLLTMRSELRGPDRVVVTVADSGPGIDPSIASRMFEPFFTTKPKGMGIGLAICRSIVEGHHGELSIVEGVTQGAAIEISLPAPNPSLGDAR